MYLQLRLKQLNLLSRINTHFTIFSDSLSCLQSLYNMNIDRPFISSILYNYHQIVEKRKIVNFMMQMKAQIHCLQDRGDGAVD